MIKEKIKKFILNKTNKDNKKNIENLVVFLILLINSLYIRLSVMILKMAILSVIKTSCLIKVANVLVNVIN